MPEGHSVNFEFKFEDGRVESAHRHINPDGSIGGWVAETAKVGQGAYIEQGSIVEPNAVVRPNDRVKQGETYPSSRDDSRL